MARVPFATRESMDAAGQAVWDEIETSRGGVQRNYAAILNNPQAASNFAHLGGYVRFQTPLDPRVKAVAVLTAAREACGHYVWTVNQPAARNAGLTDAEISAIHEYRAPNGLSGNDAAISGFVIELLRQHRVQTPPSPQSRASSATPASSTCWWSSPTTTAWPTPCKPLRWSCPTGRRTR